MNDSGRTRYLDLSRRQLRRELDAMGYGQRQQPATPERNVSTGAGGYIMALATMVALFLGLSVSGLVS